AWPSNQRAHLNSVARSDWRMRTIFPDSPGFAPPTPIWPRMFGTPPVRSIDIASFEAVIESLRIAVTGDLFVAGRAVLESGEFGNVFVKSRASGRMTLSRSVGAAGEVADVAGLLPPPRMLPMMSVTPFGTPTPLRRLLTFLIRGEATPSMPLLRSV